MSPQYISKISPFRQLNVADWPLRDYCVIEPTWLVTGSFCKQLNATRPVLRDICGIEYLDRSDY